MAFNVSLAHLITFFKKKTMAMRVNPRTTSSPLLPCGCPWKAEMSTFTLVRPETASNLKFWTCTMESWTNRRSSFAVLVAERSFGKEAIGEKLKKATINLRIMSMSESKKGTVQKCF